MTSPPAFKTAAAFFSAAASGFFGSIFRISMSAARLEPGGGLAEAVLESGFGGPAERFAGPARVEDAAADVAGGGGRLAEAPGPGESRGRELGDRVHARFLAGGDVVDAGLGGAHRFHVGFDDVIHVDEIARLLAVAV